MDPEKCRRGLKSVSNMAARRPPERSELFSLLEVPQVTNHSIGRSAPSSLLDPILDCPMLSWLFDAYLPLGAARLYRYKNFRKSQCRAQTGTARNLAGPAKSPASIFQALHEARQPMLNT